jgi:hypothetical protein
VDRELDVPGDLHPVDPVDARRLDGLGADVVQGGQPDRVHDEGEERDDHDERHEPDHDVQGNVLNGGPEAEVVEHLREVVEAGEGPVAGGQGDVERVARG